MVYIGLLPKASLSIDEVHRVGGGGVPEVMVPGDVEVGGRGGGGAGPYILLQLYFFNANNII